MKNMIFDKNVLIPMSDGIELRCNVFRPDQTGKFPVVMSFGVYGKDVHFADSFIPQWEKLKSIYPKCYLLTIKQVNQVYKSKKQS
jgi:predicted acyl esterase